LSAPRNLSVRKEKGREDEKENKYKTKKLENKNGQYKIVQPLMDRKI